MKFTAKKISALLLALALLCSLMAGCGGDNAASSAPAASVADTPAPSEAPAEPDKQPDEQEGEPVASPKPGADDPEAKPQESGKPGPVDYSGEDVRVETPWCTLVYPGEWAGALRVDKLEGEVYRIVFNAVLQGREAVELFAISFGGEGAAVGYVKAADGSAVPVVVSSGGVAFDGSWSEEEKATVHSMQEALNDILAQMPLEELVVESGEPGQTGAPATDPDSPIYADPDEETDLRIDTPYAELRFPSKWSERLSLRTSEEGVYSVDFCCKLDNGGEQLLFTLYFGGDRGIPVTTITAYDGTQLELRVEIVEIAPAADWTDEDHGYAYAMQEDMNYLFSKLG